MIHPTAIIDPGAELGKEVTVGPYAVIGPKVTIGDGCTVGSHAVIESHVRMGKGNRIHSFASVGAIPQDLKYRGEESWVEMGDGNIIREFATVNRGTAGGGGLTSIGNNTLVMAYSHLAHDCHVGSHVIMANSATLAGHVTVEDGAIIGGLTGVHQFVRIGRLAMLGGLAAATKDVPPFCTMRPTALNAVTALNVIGMRRAGMTPTERAEAKEAFRLLYRASLNVTQALEAIRGNFQGGPAIEMCDFIAASKRGICRLDDSADDDQAPDPD